MARHFDVPGTWREKHATPDSIECAALPCGHYLAEECPDDVRAAFERFFVGR